MLMIPAHMRGQQSVQEPAQIAISLWPERQMKMRGHQAVGEDANRHTIGGLTQEGKKSGVVFRLSKDLSPGIAPIDDVIAEPPD